MKRSIVSVVICAGLFAFGEDAPATQNGGEPGFGRLLTGDAAVARFPESLRQMGIVTAKWMMLTNGVEYYYGYFTNLLGTVEGYTKSKNAVHLLRIDYAKAPVRMKFVDHTQESTKKWTTSKTAARDNALFAVNLMMEDGHGRPQGYAKANGVVIPNGAELSSTGVKGGYAFNDDKTFAYSTDWLKLDAQTGLVPADAWNNIFTLEATSMHDGKVTWGASASYFSRANYPFIGSTTNGVMWIGTVDGRNSTSDGLGYHEVAALQKELGCYDGVCCDGGGSTTLAIRKDLMPASDICSTQKSSPDSSNYYTMNFLYDGSLSGILSNGSERKVINQLLFVEAPRELEEIRLDDPSSRPSTNYNGSAVSISFTGEIPDGASVSAKITLGGVDYVGTVRDFTASFTLPADVVTAGNVYDGAITVTVGDKNYTKDVRLAQGTFKVDEDAAWICESATTLNATGMWTGDKVVAVDGRIAVSNAVFTAAKPSVAGAVVTIGSTFEFVGPNEDPFRASDLAGVKVVKVGKTNRYAFLTGSGVVTNLDATANVKGAVAVKTVIDFGANTIAYTVGGTAFGPYPGFASASTVSGVRYTGETRVASLDGAYRFEGLDSNLAKAGGVEYATVAEAVSAGKGSVELLWDTAWEPSSAGDFTFTDNGFTLAIGGPLAYSVKDNGDGTVTVTVTGGDTPEAPEAASITMSGGTVKVGVADAQANFWYALEKTTDLTQPFVIDPTTWTKGTELLAGEKELVIALGGSEKQAFYRVVVSAAAP